jgi:hypothetical protein
VGVCATQFRSLINEFKIRRHATVRKTGANYSTLALGACPHSQGIESLGVFGGLHVLQEHPRWSSWGTPEAHSLEGRCRSALAYRWSILR